MRKIITLSVLLLLFVLNFSQKASAQTIGNKADIVNKTWRFVGMKCPEAMNASADNDDLVKYYMSLHLSQGNYEDLNHGNYVKIYRDMRDNPREEGTYTMVSDMERGTRLILRSKRGIVAEYRVEVVNPNHLTLIQTGNAEKCRITYAIAL